MLSIIIAVSQNNVIGKDNKLLWNIKEDLNRFKELTSEHTIIMGRKTFESLPKVLPNRYHVILTKNKDYNVDDVNVLVINDINSIVEVDLDSYTNPEEIFVIGGADIYKQFLPHAKNVYLTKVLEDFEGDSFFDLSQITEEAWNMTNESDIHTTEEGLKYQYINYERK